jgi:twitching motility protein PilU
MIDYINETRPDHILTIEDPIEFVHESKKCLINQREVHRDTLGFSEALRSALREDPDVILVGEIRDRLMNESQLEEFTRELEIDFAVSEVGLGRFRVNVFHQRGNIAMVLRFITPELPELDDLGMPEKIKELVMLRRGMILMVGANSSGKSTTLAAMINHRNMNSASHIVTIEDPIEFLHSNKKSIINQREVGLDTRSYERALRSTMREAPNVILIGEIRDRETMQATIDLAGTGHLAIATLHANNSPETLDRIINMYPSDQHKQVFMDLAQYTRAIISQRLVKSKEGERVAAVEIMLIHRTSPNSCSKAISAV